MNSRLLNSCLFIVVHSLLIFLVFIENIYKRKGLNHKPFYSQPTKQMLMLQIIFLKKDSYYCIFKYT